MTTQYSEEAAPEGDAEATVLDALAGGEPWVFLICGIDQKSNGLSLTLKVGGGLHDTETIKSLLNKAIRALP